MFSPIKFQSKRWFWNIRHLFNHLAFLINRFYFSSKDKLTQTKMHSLIFKELTKVVIPSLLLAIIIIIFFMQTENILINIETDRELLKYVSTHMQNLNVKLNKSSDSATLLLSVVVSVCGIFLGLYFTAISVIASSVYSKVPSDIRALLLKEKAGNFYIGVLIVLASLCLILIACISLGLEPGVLNIVIVTFLGCFGIVSFGVLGFRAFFFFDPTRLCDSVFDDLSRNVRSATISGFKWSDPSFQAHYHKQASHNMETLDTLIRICSEEKYLQSEPLVIIIKRLVLFLKRYTFYKSIIPPDSRWYLYAPRYKDWFLSDTTSLELAIESKSQINPEMVPNCYWLEDKAVRMIIDGLEELIKYDLPRANEILTSFNSYLEVLGESLELEKGNEFSEKVLQLIEKNNIDWQIHINKSYDEMGFYESFLLTPISLIIGLYRFIKNTNPSDLITKIDSINWDDPKQVFNGFPALLLERIEYIRSRLKFEFRVEGNLISPKWYIKQLILAQYLKLIKTAVDETQTIFDKRIISNNKQFVTQQNYVIVGFNSILALGLIHKIELTLDHLQSIVEEFNRTKVEQGLEWTSLDLDQIETYVTNSKNKLIIDLAGSLPALSSFEHKEKLPDIFGQSYTFISEYCYDLMQLKNKDTFIQIFKFLFNASLQAHHNLVDRLRNEPIQTASALILEPIIDILELSGYAKIYSELYGIPEIWEECMRVWDEYFERIGSPKDVLQIIVNCYEHKTRIFGITPRDIIHTRWRIRLRQQLEELGLIDGFYSEVSYFNGENHVNHSSAFIRALCLRRHEPYVSSAEVFILTYLRKRPESQGVEIKDRYNLEERIQKEVNKTIKE